MDKSTTFQFVTRCCILTLGAGLMLPDIPWLRPLGLLIIVAAERLPGGGMFQTESPRLNKIVFWLMVPNRLNHRFSNRRACRWVGRARLANGLRVGKPAIRQTWKSAVRRNCLVPAVGFDNHEMPIRCRSCRRTRKWALA
jgi:hypothetical protein